MHHQALQDTSVECFFFFEISLSFRSSGLFLRWDTCCWKEQNCPSGKNGTCFERSENNSRSTYFLCLCMLIGLYRRVRQLGKFILGGWAPPRDVNVGKWHCRQHNVTVTVAQTDKRSYWNAGNTPAKHHQWGRSTRSLSKWNHQTKRSNTAKQVGFTSRASSRLRVV